MTGGIIFEKKSTSAVKTCATKNHGTMQIKLTLQP